MPQSQDPDLSSSSSVGASDPSLPNAERLAEGIRTEMELLRGALVNQARRQARAEGNYNPEAPTPAQIRLVEERAAQFLAEARAVVQAARARPQPQGQAQGPPGALLQGQIPDHVQGQERAFLTRMQEVSRMLHQAQTSLHGHARAQADALANGQHEQAQAHSQAHAQFQAQAQSYAQSLSEMHARYQMWWQVRVQAEAQGRQVQAQAQQSVQPGTAPPTQPQPTSTAAPPVPQQPPPTIAARLFDVRDLTTKSDVGRQPGVKWSLSSHKPGNGVQDLLHPEISKLWQSDGTQPHFINIQFPKRTAITHLAIYLDHKLDDSYTPTKILVKGGTYFHDLVDIRYREFTEPSGWKTFIMVKPNSRVPEESELESYTVTGAPPQPTPPGSDTSSSSSAPTPLQPIHAWLLQICIIGNHLNGKDTHVRGIYVFGPPAEFPNSLFAPASAPQPRPNMTLPPWAAGQPVSQQLPHKAPNLMDILFGNSADAGPTSAQLDDDDFGDDHDEDDRLAGGTSDGAAAGIASTRRRDARRNVDDLLPPLSRNLLLGSSVR